MKPPALLSLFLLLLLLLPGPTLSQICPRVCGTIPLHYPFSTAPGCGDPRFQPYITCSQKTLSFTTHTGTYPITSIDYTSQVLYLSDPSMSTCFCSQPSKGFGLNWDAPFSFGDTTIFALLDCPNALFSGNDTSAPRCDNSGTSMCGTLYSCQPISQLSVPLSTCCVYAPVDLGPSFNMDLQKIKCKGYTAVYSFNGEENNAEGWKYGVAIKYKFNVENDYPSLCSNCEKSNGVCGYSGSYNTFICNCPSGVNTTTDCYFEGGWSLGFKLVPWTKGKWLMHSSLFLLLAWLMRE